MLKIFFILFLPLALFSKIQIVTYFPLETHIVKKIAQKEAVPREITGRYLSTFRKIPKSEISRLANAKIYFHFGLDVEKEYEKVLKEANPNLIVVDLSKNVEKIGTNPYFWTDPFAMRIVAKDIYEICIKFDKSKESFYKKNYENFLDEIDQTFLKIKQKTYGSEVLEVYAFDDYWDYFASRFRIKIIKKEKKYLTVSQIPSLIEYSRDKNIRKLLFYQGMDYNVALSLSNNLSLEIVEDNIFGDAWQLNLLEFSNNLFK